MLTRQQVLEIKHKVEINRQISSEDILRLIQEIERLKEFQIKLSMLLFEYSLGQSLS